VIYTDRIYGAIEIREPVLLELMESKAMLRLHGVLQHGISGLVGITRATSRYEHSLGVFILVRKLGGSLEEQLAALLHDVSHTAFSHVIDYVFGNHASQDYHDEKKSEYIASTDIPSILERYNYAWCDLLCLNDQEMADRFPTLEQPAPALCADRMDYFLRDSYDLGLANLAQIEQVLAHLHTRHGKMVLGNQQTALWVGKTYLEADRQSWANFREVGLYELAARAIRRGLELGVISEVDFWSTDAPTWKKLLTSADPELRTLISLVSPTTIFVRDEAQPTFRISTKLRTVNPDVLIHGRTQRLSELEPDFARLRSAYLDEYTGLWPIKVVEPDILP
jgi:hypothetical protein